MSELAKLPKDLPTNLPEDLPKDMPKDLRSIVLDYVGRRTYPPLSIDILAGPSSTSYTVSMYGELFKIDREGLEFKPFFLPCRDHLVQVLHRLVYAYLEEVDSHELAIVRMGFKTADSIIYTIDEMPYANYEVPDDKLDVLKSLKHMVGFWV
jgi:hypothetical protein